MMRLTVRSFVAATPTRWEGASIVTAALLTTAAYPPFHLFLPSFVCLAPVVLHLLAPSSAGHAIQRAAVVGFWFGLLTHGFVASWLVPALSHQTSFALLLYGVIIGTLAAGTAGVFALTRWIHHRTGFTVVILFPLMWTAYEWLLAHLGPLSYPWLWLGTSLTGYPAFIQTAEFVGARGLTFLLALANATLAVAWTQRRDRTRALKLVGITSVAIAFVGVFGVVRARSIPLRSVGRITLVQPNVGVEEKWDPANARRMLNDLLALSDDAVRSDRPDIIVWPETALPVFLANEPGWNRRIARHVQAAGAVLVTGAMDLGDGPNDSRAIYNAAFVFDRSGHRDRTTRYYKRRLAPLVERNPFPFPARRDNELTPGSQGKLFSPGTPPFGVLICHEGAFEELSRAYRRDGADFLINISNDSWFAGTNGPHQHAAHVVMRAVENRIGIARAGNGGISQLVDATGRRHDVLDVGAHAQSTGTLWTSDTTPLYTRLGDWVGMASILSMFGLIGFAGRAVHLSRSQR